ncbi:MAG: hypothetical protein ABTS22_14150 [Accumulibacter sp.]|uniref:hypothetical protein n=1 Tax=Accumulibacter sp. TaxID=2053492 RepID=UPI00331479FD
MLRFTIPEPTSSGVGGAAAFKAAFGVAGRGARLSTIVVTLMTPPRTLQEWSIVRWAFNFIEHTRDGGIDKVSKEVKEVL